MKTVRKSSCPQAPRGYYFKRQFKDQNGFMLHKLNFSNIIFSEGSAKTVQYYRNKETSKYVGIKKVTCSEIINLKVLKLPNI